MPPKVAGVASNARPSDQRSSSTGVGSGTAPLGNPTTTVTPLYGPSAPCANRDSAPRTTALSQGRVDPSYPWKHATSVISAGARTVTVAASMGADHSVPMAFQYSSSWSLNPLRAASTVYVSS